MLKQYTCPVCNKKFERLACNTKNATPCCSKKCANMKMRRGKYYLCIVCGKKVYRRPGVLHKVVCCSIGCRDAYLSESFRGSNGSNWKGEKRRTKKVVRQQGGGQQYEYRSIVEKEIGRKLLPTEVVHHVNRNPQDNEVENLELFQTSGEHLSRHSGNPTAKPIWSGRGKQYCRSEKDSWTKVKRNIYKEVKCPEEFIEMSSRGRVCLHRLVVAQQLNRVLTPEEDVHHIDKNPMNNLIENLMLFRDRSDHIKFEWGANVSPIWSGAPYG